MKRIPLTQDMADRLVAEKKRTNVGLASQLVKNEADLASELVDITRIIAGAPGTTRH